MPEYMVERHQMMLVEAADPHEVNALLTAGEVEWDEAETTDLQFSPVEKTRVAKSVKAKVSADDFEF